MKYFWILVGVVCVITLVVIACIGFYVGAQKQPATGIIQDVVETGPPRATNLNVTILDVENDQIIKLKNAVVQVWGEMHIAEDSFTYTNTFLDGSLYEITVHVKFKK